MMCASVYPKLKCDMNTIKLFAFLLFFSVLSACCFTYRPDVQQGNIVTPEQISMLYEGMTKEQVQYLLGTPVLSHILNQDRWDYVYSCQKGNGPMSVRRLSLYFDRCHLVCIRQY